MSYNWDFAPREKLFLFLQVAKTIDILKLASWESVGRKLGKIKAGWFHVRKENGFW